MNPEHDPSRTPEDPNAPRLKQIRTFQGDVAAALHTQNESIVSIQHKEVVRTLDRERAKEAEQEVAQELEKLAVVTPPSSDIEVPAGFVPEKPAHQSANMEPLTVVPIERPVPVTIESSEEVAARKHTLLLVIGTLLLISIGGGAGWYAYIGYKTKTEVPVVLDVPNKFLAYESIVNINALALNRDAFIQTVTAEKEKGSGTKLIELRRGDALNSPVMNTDTFLALMQSRASGSLVRALDPLFMLGLIGANPRHTFIIIKLDSFENAYPGMLNWEQYLAGDLLPLFATIDVVKAIPEGQLWSDVTIQNKDARVLKDLGNKTVLIYSFFDNNRLVITDTEETLRTIITRLNSEKLAR
ncbi:MAG: protein of unknown function with transrane region [Parcubacteria group bacterium]|nr:protein of unknown function with transrane region [Parcubacteria group bacterium]